MVLFGIVYALTILEDLTSRDNAVAVKRWIGFESGAGDQAE